ncbi:unnamed protein product [Symbiodinium necroappetens]|uniref:Uncharacterized protein n=1 Tax=Symbiodinium necroappetens TaxID=1628268 RepID=A0A812SFC5_9DINO|nr:unnamed protein product [Symbiodinium necroappetens]
MLKDLQRQLQAQRDSETEERLKLSQSLVELEKRVAGHEETHTQVQTLLEDSDSHIRAAEGRTLEHCNQVLDDLHYELTASMEDEGKRLQQECLQELDKVSEDIELKITSMASKVDEAAATVGDTKVFVASELEVLQQRTDGRCESVESMWEDFRRGILERLDANELTTEDLSQRLQISEEWGLFTYDGGSHITLHYSIVWYSQAYYGIVEFCIAALQELSERLDAHHAQSKKWVEAGLVFIFVHGCTCAKSDCFV